MIVYIEGCDNVGKSTQISNIWKYLSTMSPRQIPYWVHYSSYGIRDPQECYAFSMLTYTMMFRTAHILRKEFVNPIFDRAHLGEWVYGKIYRKYDANKIWEVEKEAAERYPDAWNDSNLIVFIDEPENLIERDDGLSFSTDLDKKKFEVDRFIDAYERSIIPRKRLINIAGKGPEEVWLDVKDLLWLGCM